MADSKITALASIGTGTDPANDPLVIVDVSDVSPGGMSATGTTKKVTLNNLLACSPTATLASATISGDLTVATNAFAVRASDKKTFVGTAPISTAYKFYVTLGGTAGAIAQFTDGIGQALTIDSAAGGLIVGNANNGYLAFYINGTERARIDSSGNVGIGVTPSIEKLQVNGGIVLSPPSTPPTLGTNGQLTVNATSNTNLRFSYRGSDGVTRVANLTLA